MTSKEIQDLKYANAMRRYEARKYGMYEENEDGYMCYEFSAGTLRSILKGIPDDEVCFVEHENGDVSFALTFFLDMHEVMNQGKV